jgi:hypothetical protein
MPFKSKKQADYLKSCGLYRRMKPCPFCGVGVKNFKMTHEKGCFFESAFMQGLYPMPMADDIKAWNHRV